MSDIEPGSFRDRNGRIFYIDDKVYRALSESAYSDWQRISTSELYKQFGTAGKLINTNEVSNNYLKDIEGVENFSAVLNHQTIPFVSYPYEWSFSMLKDAALLHLELLIAALNEDFILKDSSAYNVQWLDSQPVFIDIPSFTQLDPSEPWVGYRQFCQLFLYPLFFQAYKDVAFHPWLRGHIDGIEPEHINNIMSWRDLFRAGVFSHVYLQAKIEGMQANTKRNVKSDLKKAGFNKALIEANVKRLQKIVIGLEWRRSESEWANYSSQHNYSESDQTQKMAFVREVSESRHWGKVWDIGCNTGIYSKIAAKSADYVVAMDADHLAIDLLYKSLKTDGVKNILPIVMNISDASPGLGWRGKERKTLEERGCPDLTLCLALIHHVVISANVPLQEFISWLASLRSSLIIEFVSKDDEMVKTLLRNKEDQYTDYEKDYFEQCLKNAFNIDQEKPLSSGTRTLYYATLK